MPKSSSAPRPARTIRGPNQTQAARPVTHQGKQTTKSTGGGTPSGRSVSGTSPAATSPSKGGGFTSWGNRK